MRVRPYTMTLALMLTTVFAVSQPAQASQSFDQSNTPRQFLLGTGSAVGTLIYAPVKLIYAAGSVVTGGLILAYTFGQRSDIAGDVVETGMRGDWWIHPDVFTGHRDLHFLGQTP